MKKRESTLNKAGDIEGEAQCGSCHGRLGGQAGRPAGVLLSVRCRKSRSRKKGEDVARREDAHRKSAF